MAVFAGIMIAINFGSSYWTKQSVSDVIQKSDSKIIEIDSKMFAETAGEATAELETIKGNLKYYDCGGKLPAPIKQNADKIEVVEITYEPNKLHKIYFESHNDFLLNYLSEGRKGEQEQ